VTDPRDGWVTSVARFLLPERSHRWARRQQLRFGCWPPRGSIRFGTLRRLRPISRVFGFDRGQPIDRYYIEKFLLAHAQDIRGAVLEVGDEAYTLKFGQDRVTKRDVLHIEPDHPRATVVADLTHADGTPSDAFDCIIFTQTLQVIYDVRAAVRTLHRLLKPGGILLTTVPGISQISRFDMNRWGEYWRFTTLSTRRLFEEVFPSANVSIEAHGNVLAAVAFLNGLAAEDLRPEELDYHDADYQLLITARAVK
jgi:SAM-dependent methyltransferase